MEVSYYPGCSLDSTAREYGESIEAVTEALGVELLELPDWNCCGASSAHVTDDVLAIALAARNLEIAGKIDKDIVVPCAACFQRLKAAEKKLLAGDTIEGVSFDYNSNLRIMDLGDFLWEDVGPETLTSKVQRTLEGLNPVCYYGCLTSRPPKITDAKHPEDPQSMDDLMKLLGANVKNWSYKTDCCGGNLVLTRPDIAQKLIRKLLDMAVEAGADCIVAGCPMCQYNVDSQQKEISATTGKEYNIPVFYFTELMGLAFGHPAVKKWLSRHSVDAISLLQQKELI